MTDADVSEAERRTCRACGATNPAGATECERCGRELSPAIRSDAEVEAPATSGPDGGERPDEVEWRRPPPAGATPDHPLGEDRRFFESGGPGTLAEQRPLLDEEGEDVRQYTGEPVETEEGWVIPQQQNVGPGNEAGGGEWPDPATPSAMPKGDEPPADPA